MQPKILSAEIGKIMEKKYLDYGMSVIIDRALPDIRDGLKPVHRRIIFAMNELLNRSDKPYKKSARIVGDVIGKYHPHGDTAVYDSLVRMAQDFSMRVPLVDGQGNFGSIDGDSPAAMRYTESRMTKFTEYMLSDLEKDTVNYHDNYDATEKIPTVLPTPFPNLLINGTQGIAVGMATNIPPHNPIEVLNCVLKIIEDGGVLKEEHLNEYMEIMPAPDFPTGGIIHDLKEMENVWKNGHGKVYLRAKWHEEESENGRKAIIIDEIPYQVNKGKLLIKIAELVNPDENKIVKVEGVSDFRDESDKSGIRIYIEVKNDFDTNVVFNQLAKNSYLNTSINYNNTVLINGSPKQVGLITIFNEFVKHRIEVITRRTEYLLRKANERFHILKALILALDPNNVEKVIEIIRFSSNNNEARVKLMDFLKIDEIQTDAILDMKLQKLASAEISKLREEYEEKLALINSYNEILSSEEKKFEIIKNETLEMIEIFTKAKNSIRDNKQTYGIRLSETSYDQIVLDYASLVKEEECTLILTSEGYARRIPLSEMEQQNRGTRGKSRIKLREKDFIVQSLNTHSHDNLLGITETGKAFVLKAYEITDSIKGKYINSIAKIENEEKVIMLMPVNFDVDQDLVLITKTGKIKRTNISQYKNATRKGGVKAIELKDNDFVIHATFGNINDEMVLVNTANKIIRFKMENVRHVGRNGAGVIGMRINEDHDYIIGGDVIKNENENNYIVSISQKGLVKITPIDQYRLQTRGGKGILAMKVSEKAGEVFKAIVVNDLSGELITTTKKGISNRVSLSKVNVTNRTTLGVKLITMDDGDSLADVFYFKSSDDLIENIDSECNLDINDKENQIDE